MFTVRADVSFDVYLIARPTSQAARDVCSGFDLLSHNSWNRSTCQLVTWTILVPRFDLDKSGTKA